MSVASDEVVAAMPGRNMIGRRIQPAVLSYNGTRPQVYAYGGKIYQSQKRRLLVGGTGHGKAYAHLLMAIDASTAADIDALNAELPALAATLPVDCRDKPLMIMAIGWSERRQRVVGLAAASDKRFRPVVLPRGHAMTPQPMKPDPAAAEIDKRWTPAVDGDGTTEFHRLVAGNCARASAEGCYGNLSVIGGRLQIGTVTRDRVELRDDIDLDGTTYDDRSGCHVPLPATVISERVRS